MAKKKSQQSYDDYLRSSHWRKLRKRLAAKGTACLGCERLDQSVHLHHLNYRNLGKESHRDLIPLCSGCHDLLHREFDERFPEKTTSYKTSQTAKLWPEVFGGTLKQARNASCRQGSRKAFSKAEPPKEYGAGFLAQPCPGCKRHPTFGKEGLCQSCLSKLAKGGKSKAVKRLALQKKRMENRYELESQWRNAASLLQVGKPKLAKGRT